MEEDNSNKTLVITLVLVIVVLVTALALCAVFLWRLADDRYEFSAALLNLMEKCPQETLHYLREMDPDGLVLTDALRNVNSRSEAQFDEALVGIYDALTGEDEILFFVSQNAYGEDNARVLGYLAGCAEAAGATQDGIPYPKGPNGKPYEGEKEVFYDREHSYVLERAR